MNHLIAPSVLAADFGNLERDISMINNSQADWLHVDIMDGRFVPNISFGMMLVKVMKQHSVKPLDVHLMILEPEKYIRAFQEAGAENISVHVEASPHLHRTLQELNEMGVKAGVAVNPHTPVQLLFDVLENIDLVCLMSVNPGFGGQKFIYSTLSKIRQLRAEIDRRNLDTLIEIDGGVGLQNAEAILDAGADVLVAGSSVFKSKDPVGTIARLKDLKIGAI